MANKDEDEYGSDTGRGAPGTSESTTKPKIVTKEELAKSGMSLRDYMNKQQGLTRKGGDYSKPVSIVRPSPKDAKESVTRESIDSIKASGKKYPDMSALQAPAKREGMTAMEPKKMAGGGSASSRADGCCVKGKTRGKVC